MAATCGTAPVPTASCSTLSMALPSMRVPIAELRSRSLDDEAGVAVARHLVALLAVGAHAAGVGQDAAGLAGHVRAEVPAGRVRDQRGARGLVVVGDPGVLGLLRRLDR